MDGNGTTDLMVGVPKQDLGSIVCGGAVWSILTDTTIPEIADVGSWIQEDIATGESSEDRDQLGGVFAPARRVQDSCDVIGGLDWGL